MKSITAIIVLLFALMILTIGNKLQISTDYSVLNETTVKTLHSRTEGIELIDNAFGRAYQITLIPIDGKIEIRLPPAYILLYSSLLPDSVEPIEKPVWWIITLYKGEKITFYTLEPIEIIYTKTEGSLLF